MILGGGVVINAASVVRFYACVKELDIVMLMVWFCKMMMWKIDIITFVAIPGT